MKSKKTKTITRISEEFTHWVGTPSSISLHTVLFVSFFALVLLGWDLQEMLLVLTTILSIEAIYLALFIQMTVNRASESMDDVEKDIETIQEDDRKDDFNDAEIAKTLQKIQTTLNRLQKDLDLLKKKNI